MQEEHKRYFKKDSMLETNDFNRKQHFLVVTNGLDQKTIESIIYWKKNGLQIDGIIYWIFKIENNYYIEFNMYSPIENQREESNSIIRILLFNVQPLIFYSDRNNAFRVFKK